MPEAPAHITAAFEAARQRRAVPGRAALMLSPFGPLATPPTDASVCTRYGAYATTTRAQAMERELNGAATWIEAEGGEASSLEPAMGIVAGLMAAHDLPADAPVFVSGTRAADAARLADGLGDQGLTRVLLITP